MNRPYFAPENPENGKKCEPCCEPPVRHRPDWCGEADTTKIGEHWDARKQPVLPECDPCHIPPVPYAPGYSNTQQIDFLTGEVNKLIGRTNALIDSLHGYDARVFGAYQEIVNSAVCNDAYYREITIEDGVLDGGAKYKVTHIPFVDRAGQPIYFELGLAYHNTTNSGLKEDAFHASQDKLADILIPAMAPQTSWYGRAIYNKAPIPTYEAEAVETSVSNGYVAFAPKDNKYTMAVLENGFLHCFLSIATVDEMAQAKVRNAMGVESVLVEDGKYAPDMCYDTSSATAHVAVGMNFTTKERFIIVVDGSNVSGCTTEALANLFIKYGCNIAFDLCSGINSFGMDMGGFMYNPEVASSDDTPSVPEVNCYWYITKRRHYHNDYVKDMAYLTQKVSEDNFRNYILNAQADYLKATCAQLREDLTTETNERKEADDTLDKKIDAEVVTLNERIDDEVKALEAADAQLQKNIDAEAEARKSADNTLQDNINTEAKTRTDADTALRETINAEATARQNADTTLQENIDAEAKTRSSNDARLQSNIDNVANTLTSAIKDETTKRENADSALSTRIDNEIAARQNADTTLQENIDAEAKTRSSNDARLQSNIDNVANTLTSAIKDETTKRENADSALSTRIDNEIAARQNADTTLQENIDAEAKTRSSNDARLQSNIDNVANTLTSAIKDETTKRENADSALSTRIDNEIAARQNADTQLSEAVTNETTFRTQADANLKALIDAETEARETNDKALGTRVDGLNTSVDTLTETVSDLASANYLKADGSNSMEGDLNLAGYNVENVSNVVGQNLSGAYTQATLNASSGGDVAIQLAKYASDGSEATPVEVLGVATPTSDESAANKKYVDDAVSDIDLSAYAKLSKNLSNLVENDGSLAIPDIVFKGSVFTMEYPGNVINLSSISEHIPILQLGYAYGDGDPSNRSYVEYRVYTKDTRDYPTLYLNFYNGTVHADLGFSVKNSLIRIFGVGVPADSTDVANKFYVDTVIKSAKSEILATAGSSYVSVNGGTMTGDLTLKGAGVASQDTVGNAEWKLETSGGVPTFTGSDGASSIAIAGVATPTADEEAANKKYVDDTISALNIGNYMLLTGNNSSNKSVALYGSGTKDFRCGTRGQVLLNNEGVTLSSESAAGNTTGTELYLTYDSKYLTFRSETSGAKRDIRACVNADSNATKILLFDNTAGKDIRISGCATPVDTNDVTNKDYVDATPNTTTTRDSEIATVLDALTLSLDVTTDSLALTTTYGWDKQPKDLKCGNMYHVTFYATGAGDGTAKSATATISFPSSVKGVIPDGCTNVYTAGTTFSYFIKSSPMSGAAYAVYYDGGYKLQFSHLDFTSTAGYVTCFFSGWIVL